MRKYCALMILAIFAIASPARAQAPPDPVIDPVLKAYLDKHYASKAEMAAARKEIAAIARVQQEHGKLLVVALETGQRVERKQADQEKLIAVAISTSQTAEKNSATALQLAVAANAKADIAVATAQRAEAKAEAARARSDAAYAKAEAAAAVAAKPSVVNNFYGGHGNCCSRTGAPYCSCKSNCVWGPRCYGPVHVWTDRCGRTRWCQNWVQNYYCTFWGGAPVAPVFAVASPCSRFGF